MAEYEKRPNYFRELHIDSDTTDEDIKSFLGGNWSADIFRDSGGNLLLKVNTHAGMDHDEVRIGTGEYLIGEFRPGLDSVWEVSMSYYSLDDSPEHLPRT